VADLEILTFKLETMIDKNIEHQEPINPPLLIAEVIERLSFRGKRLYRTICEYAKGEDKSSFFLNEKAIDYHLADFGASTAIWELKRAGLVDFRVEEHENMNFRKEKWYRGQILNAL
jgi:hypothetical protein